MTTGGDNETRTAVEAALLGALGIRPVDADMEGSDEVLDAVLAAMYSQPWLIELVQMADREGYTLDCLAHRDSCIAVPRAVREAAGIEEEA